MLYLLPFITAFTSWLGVWVMSRMICYPIRPFHVLGFKVHGLVPSKKNEIIAAITQFVSTELADTARGDTFNDPALFQQLSPTVEKHLDTFLKVKLQETLPMVATFMGDSTLAKIKQGMLTEIEMLLPEIITQYGQALGTQHLVPHISRKLNDNFDQITIQLAGFSSQAVRKKALFPAAIGFITGCLISFVAYLVHIF